MMKRIFCLGLLCLSGLSNIAIAKTHTVSSPDGLIELSVNDDNGAQYAVKYRDSAVINPSKLGFAFKRHAMFGPDFTIEKVSKVQSHQSSWQLPWGERETVVDHHNQLVVTFAKGDKSFDVRIRVFNDGLGFRYEVPQHQDMKQVEITDELTEFYIADPRKTTAWWIPSGSWNRYEYVYETTGLEVLDNVHTPLTMKQPNGVHVSIHEAALVDYASMRLDQRRHGVLKADLAPWSDGIKVKTKTSFKTPWRTIQISPDAVGLLNSDLILNLNEPNKLGDVSWVKPGKYVGIWWGMHINENTWGSGEKHGATTSETMRYMDFAAKYGFDGVLVEGWNIGWDGDWFINGDVFNFTKSYDDFDLAKISAYGKSKGVRLIGHHETSGNVTNYAKQMDAGFDLYQKHGVTQVKTGYVADGGGIKRIDDDGIARYEWHDGQFMAGEYLNNIKAAAKRKISINTHEPIKDTGLRRTYPNWISREGARGMEYNAWGTPPNPPEHTAVLPYTRMLSGPMDYTPGIFEMGFRGDLHNPTSNRPQTTIAKQLALYVVLYSPIQMAADLPRNYEKRLDAFQFIQDVPTDWRESVALAGEVGDFVVFARQNKANDDWFLGALTDENARSVEVKLDFLTAGKRYEAQIYRDGDKADWVKNPYELVIEKRQVMATDRLMLNMATSGGVAVRFKAL